MSKKHKRDREREEGFEVFRSLQDKTIQSVIAIIFFVFAVFFLLSSFGKAGMVGASVFKWLSILVGIGYFLIPLILIVLGISYLRSLKKSFAIIQAAGSLVLFLSGLGLIDLARNGNGGIVGKIIADPLVGLFDVVATAIFLSALVIISTLLIFDIAIQFDPKPLLNLLRKILGIKVKEEPGEEVDVSRLITKEKTEKKIEEKIDKKKTADEPVEKDGDKVFITKPEEEIEVAVSRKIGGISHKPYVPPPLSLLERDSGKPGVGDIKANANIIKRTLQNFGINVEMDEISIGPSVTRYALKPAEGVKLSKIVTLQNDLSLALAAHPIRIEAPIPGKSLVGIEIPNSTKTTVGLGSLVANEEFQNSPKPLLISLGKGVTGKSYYSDLGKMPHLLIAGATGSGKSVTIHAIITSLLYKNGPETLKFIMIDPKRVELTLYNKIPHLLTPVITDAKKAILSLKWAAKEMERRYNILEKESVRDVESYHKNVLTPALKKLEKDGKPKEGEEMPDLLPYIVIVIDELADIMQTYPRELESSIVRLAQMSRAVGIHLMLSTQRPSVNVITGLIKANIPARIALQVASQVDSRTILDMSGAEKLLGAGDMLWLSGDMSKPQRIQSSFISENEVKKVVKYLGENYENEVMEEIAVTSETNKNTIFDSNFDEEEVGDDDELYEEAREIVVSAGKASTSYLQRKLKIGYARAARLIDMLEDRGVVGPGEGAKPREVIGYQGTPQEEEV